MSNTLPIDGSQTKKSPKTLFFISKNPTKSKIRAKVAYSLQ
jgi:hypothetical protein